MVEQLGFGVIGFELDLGEYFDLTRPCVRKLIKGLISSGCIRGVHLATICKTWSSAWVQLGRHQGFSTCIWITEPP